MASDTKNYIKWSCLEILREASVHTHVQGYQLHPLSRSIVKDVVHVPAIKMNDTFPHETVLLPIHRQMARPVSYHFD